MKEQMIPFFFARIFSEPSLYKVRVSKHEAFRYGSEIILETERGLNIAVVTSWKINEEKQDVRSSSVGTFIRYATAEDKKKRHLLDQNSVLIKSEINTLVEELNLEMYVTNILTSLSDDSICIYYTAKNRVDFRELLVSLRQTYKKKIIFRQINKHERKSGFLFSADLYSYNSHNRV